jgi:hypothetical protein
MQVVSPPLVAHEQAVGEQADAALARIAFARIGGVCACVGGTIATVGNVLHGPADATEDGLRELASNGHFGIYRGDHFILVLALLTALIGLAAIADSFRGASHAWARAGNLVGVMGTAVVIVALGIDGFALVTTARAWASAVPADQGAYFLVARGLWNAFLGIFALGVFSYFGLLPFFYGAAIRRATIYPRWLGLVAYAGGLVGLVLGLLLAFVTITFQTFQILFGTSATLFSVWVAWCGVCLWASAKPAR